MAILRVDAHENWNGAVARQIFGRRLARYNLPIDSNRVFKINDDRISAAGSGLCKTVRPVTRDEKERTQFHALIMPLARRYGNLSLLEQCCALGLAYNFVALVEATVKESHNASIWP